MKTFLAMVALCLACSAAVRPTSQPIRPPIRISVEITSTVSLQKEVPLKVTLFSESDDLPAYQNYSFMFALLDDKGQQVGGANVFIREAIFIDLHLRGRQAVYEPRLAFYAGREGLVAGRRYQLICVLPDAGLAGSASFTLAE